MNEVPTLEDVLNVCELAGLDRAAVALLLEKAVFNARQASAGEKYNEGRALGIIAALAGLANLNETAVVAAVSAAAEGEE